MPPASYSFLDVAVLDVLRERFASGDALVVLSTDLEEVIWANGAGAELFGYPDIEAIIGASSRLGFATKRQISATKGFPAIGRDRALLLRMTTGMSSRAMALLASEIRLPDGEMAISLAAPAATDGARSDRDIAERAIGGFAEAGHFVAFVDAHGAIEAASAGFAELGLTAETLASLVEKAGGEGSRIVKRMVPGKNGPLPAGMARLTETRHLLVVIDEGRALETVGQPAAAEAIEEPTAAETVAPPAVAETPEPASVEDGAAHDVEAERAAHDVWYFTTEDAASAETGALPEADAPPEAEVASEAEHGESEQQQPALAPVEALTSETETQTTAEAEASAQIEERAEAPQENPAMAVAEPPADVAAIAPGVDRASGPVRFVWRTDAEGKFSQISPEFSHAVGAEAADIVGRRFEDVTNILGLDPTGEIAGLLARRDTWSGRSVLWPVAGTDLKIPVDLAALPVYDRTRTFEGFRGFGVARTGDAVVDPEAIGLVLVKAPPEIAEVPDEDVPDSEAAADTAEKPADPFQGEVPALSIVPMQDRRFTDKVIRLAEHRQPPANDKGLSTGERIAFQQIGERLKKDTETVPAEPEAEADTTGADEPTGLVAPLQTDTDVPLSERDDGADAGEVAAPFEVVDVADSTVAESDPTGEPESLDDAVGDSAGVADLLTLDGASGEDAVSYAAEEDGTAADAMETLPADPAPTPIEPTAEVDPTVEQNASATGKTEETVARAEPETVTPPRKTGRPGLSLLDFAQWDEDDKPAETAVVDAATPTDAGQAVDGGPVASAELAPEVVAQADDTPPVSETAETKAEEATPLDAGEDVRVDGSTTEAVVVPARIPVALVEMEEAAALDERVPRVADNHSGRSDIAEPTNATEPAAAFEAAPADEATTATGSPDATEPLEERRPEAPALQAEGFAPSASPVVEAEQKAGSGLSILEKLPVPVLVHSGDTLHYANHEFFALTGYPSVEDLSDAGGIGVLFADPYEDEDAGNDARGKIDRQLRLKTRDGDEFPVEAFLQSVPWNGGKALLLVLSRAKEGAYAAGSTSQSPLIAELEARVAEMRTIIDTATDGVVLIARDGTIRSISRPAEALFGFDSDDVTGKPFASLFAIESQRAARDYLNGLSDNGVASVLNDGREVIGRESEGRFIPLFMTIGKLPGDSGYCAVVRDITQWKRAEEDLTQARAVAERASSHKTDFLARVSHEIRTPLNAIIGFSELMIDEKFGPVANDRYRDYLRDINRSGNHVLDLVNDLLDISKIEAGQQEMAYEAVSLNDTLAETVAMMQPQANRERVIIRSSFASKLPDVVADLRSVRQIALNILSNAVRYTQAGGQVIVSTAYEAAGDVVMRVRDTGIGMTYAEIEQALKPFKQINSLKRARGDGTGLGLPLTKAMVEANRAKFSINSTPGEGTLVEISFPSTRVLAE